MPRETPQHLRELHPRIGSGDRLVPEGEALRHCIHLVRRHAERSSDVAHRAFRPIADHGGGDGRTGAAVFLVDVLDHLLAPLVLEVDIDVRRLVPLARDEALEQHVHARRIHLGDAERITHHRVRRRAASLAENAARAGVADQVFHREKERLIAKLGDERELVLGHLAHLRRHATGKAPAQAVLGQLREPALRRMLRRHEFRRIFVAQLMERKAAALGDRHALREQFRRVKLRQPHAKAQAPLGVRVQRLAALRHRFAEPHGAQHIVQALARAQVHVHVARGDERQAILAAELAQLLELGAVVRPAVQLRGEPSASGKALREP